MTSMTRSFNHRVAGFIAAIVLILILWLAPGQRSAPITHQVEQLQGIIPNQVHYVYILNDTSADFNFGFKHFMSVYSTWYYFKPHTIYLHTDASPETIQRARGKGAATESNKWTRRIFNIPNVRVNRVTAPSKALVSGQAIKLSVHKSDFVRVEAIRDFGGVYLDFDAHPIRDVSPLRKAGFKSVVGLQSGGQVQSGTFMATKGAALTKLWSEQQHIVYDGKWLTHSNNLVDKIAPRLVKIPNEVLIMEPYAFTPDTWEPWGKDYMYKTHPEVPPASIQGSENTTFPDDDEASAVMDRWEKPENFPDWAEDYSRTYVVHAFSTDRGKKLKIPGFNGITPEYILNRQSNFARAMYPAMRHAYDQGWFELKD